MPVVGQNILFPTSIRMEGMSVRATIRAMIMAMAMMIPRDFTNEKSAVAMARKAMITVEALVATDSPAQVKAVCTAFSRSAPRILSSR
ncbi:hypothetical protein DSECCO2_228350 [anaerobic digester metagenome]